jgi:hypothetical protein
MGLLDTEGKNARVDFLNFMDLVGIVDLNDFNATMGATSTSLGGTTNLLDMRKEAYRQFAREIIDLNIQIGAITG